MKNLNVMQRQHLKLNYKILNLEDKDYLIILKSTFKTEGIPSVYYSIDGYSEDAICIERDDNYWIVYNGERGNKYNIKNYDNVIFACYNMIYRLSESRAEKLRIQNIFEHKIYEICDTPEVKITILTINIKELTKYLQENQSDHHSKRVLLNMISQRRKLLYFLKRKDRKRYYSLISKLGIKDMAVKSSSVYFG